MKTKDLLIRQFINNNVKHNSANSHYPTCTVMPSVSSVQKTTPSKKTTSSTAFQTMNAHIK